MNGRQTSMNVLFRVESGPEIGIGHLRRSLSLATALRREGVQSGFLTDNPQGNLDYVVRFGFSAESVLAAIPWSDEDLKITVKAATRFKAHAIVVDCRDVPATYLVRLKDAGLFVIVRDDLARYPFPAHIVINGNADARQLPYVSCNGTTLFLLGPEYAVLPQDFWNPSKRAVRGTVQQMLVILGGADFRGLMPKLLRLLDGLPGDFTVTAVVGPFFGNRPEVLASANRALRRVRVVESPHSVCDLMLEADVAISAAGQTLYELACVGCPTVAIQVASNQGGQLKALSEAGCVRDAGDAERADIIPRVRQVLLPLLSDPTTRAGMATAGQGLVDGQGACRVGREILAKTSLAEAHWKFGAQSRVLDQLDSRRWYHDRTN